MWLKRQSHHASISWNNQLWCRIITFFLFTKILSAPWTWPKINRIKMYFGKNYTLSFSESSFSIVATLLLSSTDSCSNSRNSCFASSTCWFTWALRNNVASFSSRSRSNEMLRLALRVRSASRASLSRATSKWRVALPDFSPGNKSSFNAVYLYQGPKSSMLWVLVLRLIWV